MEIIISFDQQPALQEAFQVEDLAGEGKFKVYSIYSHIQQTKYALKIFPKDALGSPSYKKDQIISLLNHPNIIKSVPITYQSRDFHFLMTEFAPFGNFLNLTASNIFQSETLVRTYFRQLIEGIEYLHSQGVAHLDLKLENLVLGSDYKLKIIDFDQAQSIKDTRLKCRGSADYRPLEVINRKCKDLAAMDVYSAGIILYTMIAKEFPFKEIYETRGVCLYHYSTFVKDNAKFWKMKADRLKNPSLFSEDLIDLFNRIFECDAEKRIKLSEIKESKWYQGPVVEGERLTEQIKSLLANLPGKDN